MKVKTEVKIESGPPQKGRKKKAEEPQEVWKWYVNSYNTKSLPV